MEKVRINITLTSEERDRLLDASKQEKRTIGAFLLVHGLAAADSRQLGSVMGPK